MPFEFISMIQTVVNFFSQFRQKICSPEFFQICDESAQWQIKMGPKTKRGRSESPSSPAHTDIRCAGRAGPSPRSAATVTITSCQQLHDENNKTAGIFLCDGENDLLFVAMVTCFTQRCGLVRVSPEKPCSWLATAGVISWSLSDFGLMIKH